MAHGKKDSEHRAQRDKGGEKSVNNVDVRRR